MARPEEKTVDVAIVGAGPAGLIAAAWMAVANVKTILIDKHASPPPYGHADGLEQRSFEILDAFQLGHTIWQSAHKTIQVAYWKSINHTLSRQFITQNSSKSSAYSSFYCEATLAQGRIEERLIDFLRQHENVEILRNHHPTDMHISHDVAYDVKAEYPVHLHIEKMSTHLATPEAAFIAKGDHGMHIRSRYLIGSDGAHSWVRKRLGLEMQGEATQDHWGVLDCVPITDFPDIRKRCIIHSSAGNAMIIPRERRLVRFYVELCRRPDEDEKYGAEDILGKIVEILKPYHFSTQIVEWESTYSVGRRLCMGLSTRDVAFLVGDAIHTHSPKAGQGMNTSMQDAFNLGWKLAYVVRGMASSEIFHTYHQERAPIAERLLKFDEEIYNAVSDKCHGNDASGLLGTLAKENTSASGLSVEYGRNLLVSDAPRLSSVFLKLGSRLPDLHVLNHSDGHIWRVHSLLNISASPDIGGETICPAFHHTGN
uniref:FAD-binding domain-containing protein n=1 Tax=Bionectria ochroleuca TaxID=29856 RepID=A0A8H7TUH2_BIOOC